MRGFSFYVTNCVRCPYREADQDGDSYCATHEGYHEARVHVIRENSDGITPTCPLYGEASEGVQIRPQDLVAWTLIGNGQSNPKAGPVSWALQRQFESIVKQFAKSLGDHVPDFDQAEFFQACGIKEFLP